MKLQRALRILVVTGLGVATVASAAFGFGWSRWHSMTPKEKAERFAARIQDELDLDADQKAKLDALTAELIALGEAAHKDREARMAGWIEMFKGERLDTAALTSAYAERRDAWEERMPAVLDKVADLHASLNAEQKQEILEFWEEHRGRHGWWRHQ